MSIQIIDGFQVNTALPIDNRIVASGSAARNAIPFKYEGLRVFDTSDGIPYVYLNNNWVSENASGILASGTTANYIPRLSGNNVVVNSIIYATGSNIGVNTISPSVITGETTTFHVNGGIRANKFQGDGSLINNIPGSNINNGSIPVSGAGSKLANDSTGNVLISGVSNTSWTSQSQLSVGTASTSLNSNITRVPTGSGTHYLTFIGSGAWSTGSGIGAGVGNEVIRANNADLSYIPGARTLSVGTVSSTRLITSGDVRVGTNLNCVGGLIDIGVTGVSRNAYLFSGGTGVTELASFLNRPIIFSTGNTTLSEKVRITSGGNFLIANLGSVAAPAISFTSDSNTGIYAPSGDNLAFVTGGIERFRVRAGDASDFEFKSPNNLKKVGLSVYDSGYTTWTMSSSTTSTFDIIGYSGVVINGSLSKSSGSFRIDHPLESKKSTHDLVHSFVEGPRADNIYRGKVILNNGSATINLDIESNMTEGTFILLNREVQCFTTNETGWTAVKGRVTGNVLQINSEVSCSDEISWMVIGERQDKHMYDTDWTDSNGKVIVEPLKKK
jgi:hypothetical protein